MVGRLWGIIMDEEAEEEEEEEVLIIFTIKSIHISDVFEENEIW